MSTCYQCGKQTEWLAPDSRCGDCTRYTPDEIKGETTPAFTDSPRTDLSDYDYWWHVCL